MLCFELVELPSFKFGFQLREACLIQSCIVVLQALIIFDRAVKRQAHITVNTKVTAEESEYLVTHTNLILFKFKVFSRFHSGRRTGTELK